MKCSHCGIQNDESAKFCKNCGTRLSEETTQTAEYTILDDSIPDKNNQEVSCPNCGSTNIHFVTKQSGSDYDPGNACCGYLIFGPIGLICGLFSDKKNETVRKCMKCGHEF